MFIPQTGNYHTDKTEIPRDTNLLPMTEKTLLKLLSEFLHKINYQFTIIIKQWDTFSAPFYKL